MADSASPSKGPGLQNELHKLQEAVRQIDPSEMQATVSKLTEQVQRINSKLQASIATLSQDGSPAPSTAAAGIASPEKANAAAASRAKIDKMSAEVVDSNPYSRLMALQRMGIVKDYERIRTKTVSSSV
eukprot:GHUV01045188.1.p1 GENE.GHUV01045188.1~~GHUV01045188.1.p1  ORF type:complete len:129 (-),score=42.84 GHUV01045188.1:441-827(-)